MSIWTGRDGYDSVNEFTVRTDRALDGDAAFCNCEMGETGSSELFLSRLNEVVAGKRVLDIGCGFGKWAQTLDGFRSYTGIDVVERRVKYARTLGVPHAEFIHIKDGNWAGVPIGAFDVALSVTVLQHLNLAQAKRVLVNAHTALRPNGTLMLREGRISDVTEGEAEAAYLASTSHMIPKPISALKSAATREGR